MVQELVLEHVAVCVIFVLLSISVSVFLKK